MSKQIPQSVTFEEAMSELEKIVAQLENGKADLEQSIVLYERGALLRAHCEAKLKAAQLRVEQIIAKAGEAPTITPFEHDK